MPEGNESLPQTQLQTTISIGDSSLPSASCSVAITRQPSPRRAAPGLAAYTGLLSSVVCTGTTTAAGPTLPYDAEGHDGRGGHGGPAGLGALGQGCGAHSDVQQRPEGAHGTTELLAAAAARLNAQAGQPPEQHQQHQKQLQRTGNPSEAHPGAAEPNSTMLRTASCAHGAAGAGVAAVAAAASHTAASLPSVLHVDGLTRSRACRTASLDVEPSAEQEGVGATEAASNAQGAIAAGAVLPPLHKPPIGIEHLTPSTVVHVGAPGLPSRSAGEQRSYSGEAPRALSCALAAGRLPPGAAPTDKARMRVCLPPEVPHSPTGLPHGTAASPLMQHLNAVSALPSGERSELPLIGPPSRSRAPSLSMGWAGALPSMAHGDASAALRRPSPSRLSMAADAASGSSGEDPGPSLGRTPSSTSQAGGGSGCSGAGTNAGPRRPVPYSAAETPILNLHNLPTRACHIGAAGAKAHGGAGPSCGGGTNAATGPAGHGRQTPELAERPQQQLPALHRHAVSSPTSTVEDAGLAGLQPRSRSVAAQTRSESCFSLRRSAYCDWTDNQPLEERLGICLGSVSASGGAAGSGPNGKMQVLKRHLQDRAAPVYFKPAYQKPLLGGDVLHVL